jgi:hypothetical protein
MTRASLAEIDPFFEPQVAHAPTILLDPAKMGVDTASSATRLDSGSMLLSRFKLLEMIGEGGMSRVFKAVDLRKVEAGAADPHIAIKVLTVPFACRISRLGTGRFPKFGTTLKGSPAEP